MLLERGCFFKRQPRMGLCKLIVSVIHKIAPAWGVPIAQAPYSILITDALGFRGLNFRSLSLYPVAP